MKDFFSQDFDKTVTAVGAVILAFYIVSKVFGLHDDGDNSIISPEIIMAIINIPTAFLAFAIGKKVGENSNGTSGTKNRGESDDSDPPPSADH